MTQDLSQILSPLTRRRFLHGTMSGMVGLAAWQGWPSMPRAMAQKNTPERTSDVGDSCEHCAYLV